MKTPMTLTDHLDIQGASGTRYRFRRVQNPSTLPAEGGNFLYVKEGAEGVVVIGSGASETLHQAHDLWKQAVERHGAEAIYVRLNIGRAQRLREHEDIAAENGPDMQII
jgi:hypothetical protein